MKVTLNDSKKDREPVAVIHYDDSRGVVWFRDENGGKPYYLSNGVVRVSHKETFEELVNNPASTPVYEGDTLHITF